MITYREMGKLLFRSVDAGVQLLWPGRRPYCTRFQAEVSEHQGDDPEAGNSFSGTSIETVSFSSIPGQTKHRLHVQLQIVYLALLCPDIRIFSFVHYYQLLI